MKSIKNTANNITEKTKDFAEGAANKGKKAEQTVGKETSSAMYHLGQSMGNFLN